MRTKPYHQYYYDRAIVLGTCWYNMPFVLPDCTADMPLKLYNRGHGFRLMKKEPVKVEILLKGSFFNEASIYITSRSVRSLSNEDYYVTLGFRLIKRRL